MNWWYVAVVPAVGFALAASSFRMVDVYLPTQYHRAQSAVAGETLNFSQVAKVEGESYPIDAAITVNGVHRLRDADEPTMVEGTAIDVIAIDLDWEAAPDVPLKSCSMRLITEEGFEYVSSQQATSTFSSPSPALAQLYSCTPSDAPGPGYGVIDEAFGLFEEEAPRPESWSTTVYFIVPDGAEPSRMQVRWVEPEYAEFTDLKAAGEVELPGLSFG
ncbi:hypothetical protein [Corynebacterium atrinae]|uniref:hypothetical protein n=1 Tax=Corynebacterium atrinae TaxID=1336740 RepID=UPI0025B3F321|nr:hypothetical protein [Corynebacterium atrinae]